jgi:F0F1-type ATP synthase membrane subunit b/b'
MHIPPDWGTFIILIVSFLVFWFIFNRLFIQPFLLLLENRERRLRELDERAAQLTREKESAESRRAAELAALRREELAQRETERRKAEAEAQQTLERARTAARDAIEQARADVQRELAAAQADLERTGRRLATELVEKLLLRPIETAGNRTDR